MQPSQCAFDHPARLAQTAAMLRIASGQQTTNAAPSQSLPMRLRVVGAIALDLHADGAREGIPGRAVNGCVAQATVDCPRQTAEMSQGHLLPGAH